MMEGDANQKPELRLQSAGQCPSQSQPPGSSKNSNCAPKAAPGGSTIKVRFGPIIQMDLVIRQFNYGAQAKPSVDLKRSLTPIYQFNATIGCL